MALCPTCGTEMTPDMAFCPNCGTPAPVAPVAAPPVAGVPAEGYLASAPGYAATVPSPVNASQAETGQSGVAAGIPQAAVPPVADATAAAYSAQPQYAYTTPSYEYSAAAQPFPGQPATAVQQPAEQPTGFKRIFHPNDHTADFTAEDISQNKVFAVLTYFFSFYLFVFPISLIGAFFTAVAARNSPYAMFHVRQATKIVVSAILLVCAIALVSAIALTIASIPAALTDDANVAIWATAIVGGVISFLTSLCVLLLLISNAVCFFNSFRGKAKEPLFVSALKFLK